jgi:two-component system, NarL family, sensor histidine kinase DegS
MSILGGINRRRRGPSGFWSDVTTFFRGFPARLREPAFWHVQLMVAAITVAHYVTEWQLHDEPYSEIHWIPVILYIFPIIYGSLKFGLEGGLLTGIWCWLLSLPNILLWHASGVEWLVEAVQLSVAVVVGLVLSRLVRHEAVQRKAAEDMADRLALLNRYVSEAQESERQRVARELHDETAQSMIVLCQSLDALMSTPRLPKQARWRLEEVRTMSEHILSGVRRFSRDLRPPMLDDLGLAPALDWLASDLTSRVGVPVKTAFKGQQRRLPPDSELALFRIAQEALRNVEKHAEASEVALAVTFEPSRVYLKVSDNGRGFVLPRVAQDLAAEGKLGLAGIQERAQLLGGVVRLSSNPGQGTTVEVSLNSSSV